jgi:hypothetical protein
LQERIVTFTEFYEVVEGRNFTSPIWDAMLGDRQGWTPGAPTLQEIRFS